MIPEHLQQVTTQELPLSLGYLEKSHTIDFTAAPLEAITTSVFSPQ